MALLPVGSNGDAGNVFESSGRSYDPNKPIALASVALTPEHYNRISRLMKHNIPVKLQFNIQNQFFEDNLDSVNVIAEIHGCRKKNEIVTLGSQRAAWHRGHDATHDARSV